MSRCVYLATTHGLVMFMLCIMLSKILVNNGLTMPWTNIFGIAIFFGILGGILTIQPFYDDQMIERY